MEIIFKNSITVEEYNDLREAVGWDKLCADQALQGLKNSTRIISCYHKGKIVGSARLIWDKGYICYLSDVMVSPEFQKNGIGRQMVESLLQYLKAQIKPGWKIKVVLTSRKGKEDFYKKLGFIERPNSELGPAMEQWIK